jgi:plasmid stabilization system protein ParE
MKVRYTNRAFRDREEILTYLKARSPSGGRNVLERFDAAAALLGKQPSAVSQRICPTPGCSLWGAIRTSSSTGYMTTRSKSFISGIPPGLPSSRCSRRRPLRAAFPASQRRYCAAKMPAMMSEAIETSRRSLSTLTHCWPRAGLIAVPETAPAARNLFARNPFPTRSVAWKPSG